MQALPARLGHPEPGKENTDKKATVDVVSIMESELSSPVVAEKADERCRPPVIDETIADLGNDATVSAGEKAEADPGFAQDEKQMLNQTGELILEISENQQLLITNLVSTVKHKLQSVDALIYLGAFRAQPGQFLPLVYLLVIVNNAETRQGHVLSGIIEESCKPFAVVTALIHRAADWQKAVAPKKRFFLSGTFQARSLPVRKFTIAGTAGNRLRTAYRKKSGNLS